jgi:hypothetical protein
MKNVFVKEKRKFEVVFVRYYCNAVLQAELNNACILLHCMLGG